MNRHDMAFQIYCSLIANPERYKYISKKVEQGELDQDSATEKNINKAFRMEDQFIVSARSK